MGEGIDPILEHLLGGQAQGTASPLRLKGCARRSEGLELFLETVAETSDASRWRVLVEGCSDFGLVEEPIETACVLREHPVLWRHRPPEAELHLTGGVGDPERACDRLLRAHRRVIRDATHGFGSRWVLPGHFGADLDRLSQVLREAGGRIARGPEALLEAYAAALQEEGASPSILALPRAKSPSGPRGGPSIALFLGESFAVGTALDCRRA